MIFACRFLRLRPHRCVRVLTVRHFCSSSSPFFFFFQFISHSLSIFFFNLPLLFLRTNWHLLLPTYFFFCLYSSIWALPFGKCYYFFFFKAYFLIQMFLKIKKVFKKFDNEEKGIFPTLNSVYIFFLWNVNIFFLECCFQCS